MWWWPSMNEHIGELPASPIDRSGRGSAIALTPRDAHVRAGRSGWMGWTALALFASLQVGASGWLPRWLHVGCEVACAAALVWSAAPDSRSRVLVRVLRLALAVAAVALSHRVSIDALSAFGVAVALVAAPSAAPAQRDQARAIAWIVGAFAVARLAIASPFGAHALEQLSGALSVAASAAIREKVNLGPTYSGALALCVCVLLISAAGFSRRGARAVALVSLALTGLVAAGAVSLGARLLPPFGSDDAGLAGRWLATQLPWVALAPLLAVTVALLARSALSESFARAVFSVCCLAGLLCVAGAAPVQAGRPVERWKVYEKGYLSWGRPDDRTFGEYSAGMLGTLPDFIESSGGRTEFITEIDAAALAQADALVIVNLDHALSAAALDALDEFVVGGGSLFVVGDHTFLQGEAGSGVLHLNAPLRSTQIAFANDSADPLAPGWFDATWEVRVGAPFLAEAGNPSGAVVGGALWLGPRARPLVVGRHGYVDLGIDAPVDAARGWLGDLMWNPGERLGDVVLCAEQRLGAGRVVVVGDTTGLTNLGRTARWRWWTDAMFAQERGPHGGRLALPVALALALLASLLWPNAERWQALAAPTTAAVVFAGSALHAPRPAALVRDARRAIVEFAVRPDGPIYGWEPTGLLSIGVSLEREGWRAVHADTRTEEVLQDSGLLVVTRPQVDPGANWARDVLAWVHGGGALIVSASHEQSLLLERVLAPLEIGVLPHVLGPVQVPSSSEAPVLRHPFFIEAWELELRSAEWTVWAARGEAPLCARRQWGAGVVTVIGDARFLTNHALEGSLGVQRDNIDFFRAIAGEPGE